MLGNTTFCSVYTGALKFLRLGSYIRRANGNQFHFKTPKTMHATRMKLAGSVGSVPCSRQANLNSWRTRNSPRSNRWCFCCAQQKHSSGICWLILSLATEAVWQTAFRVSSPVEIVFITWTNRFSWQLHMLFLPAMTSRSDVWHWSGFGRVWGADGMAHLSSAVRGS